jgi:tetratricopeptide (TPR) repeat protein
MTQMNDAVARTRLECGEGHVSDLMTQMDDDVASVSASPFPSHTELRKAHSELLKRYQDEGETPEFWAEVEAFILRGRATGSLLDADSERWDSQSLLDYWATLMYRAGRPAPNATLAAFDPTLLPNLDDSQCPYLGLSAFQEADRDHFFGRERLVEDMLHRLGEGQRFLAVIGPSGSGKSSLVLAGLLPALKGGKLPGSDSWRYFPRLVPGSDPLTSLALALKPDWAEPDWVSRQATAFRQEPVHLSRLVQEYGTSPAVLVVDQFEEVFTLCNDDEARQAFAVNLAQLVQHPGDRHTVILTLRSDFEPQVARLSALQPLMEQPVVRVTPTPLSARDLARAIEKPAEHVGLKFEEGLVDDLVREVLGEPAALPLLQFTLLKLWESRDRNRVTRAAYAKVGGSRLALARSADELYSKLIPEDQEMARRIFLRLVSPGDGFEVLRDRVRRDSLLPLGALDRVERVLDKLVEARLICLTKGVTAADDQVEVVHEALVRNWPKFTEWLNEEHERRRQRWRLTAAAELWLAHGKDPGGLLGGSLLEEARRYKDRSPLENEFVQASQELAEEELREKMATQRHEVEQAQALVEEQRRRAEAEERRAEEQSRATRLFLWLSVALFVLSLSTIALAIYAFNLKTRAEEGEAEANRQRERAEKSRTEAVQEVAQLIASKLVQNAVKNLARPKFSLLLTLKAVAALESEHLPLTDEVLNALQHALFVGQPSSFPYDVHAVPVTAIALSPDGRRLVTASEDETAKIWDTDTGAELRTLPRHNDAIRAVAFDPDGQRLATASDDTTAKVWDANTGKELFTLDKHLNGVHSVAFSLDGRRLATGSADKTVKVWDANTGGELLTLHGHNDTIRALSFSPNGRVLASASQDRTVKLWDTSAGTELLPPFKEHAFPVLCIAFSPDGNRVATASGDGVVKVWDSESGTVISSLYAGRSILVGSLAFTDGTRLATCADDNKLQWWDATTGTALLTIPLGQRGRLSAVGFSKNGQRLAAARDEKIAGRSFTVQVYDFQKIEDPLTRAREFVDGSKLSLPEYKVILEDVSPPHAQLLKEGQKALQDSPVEVVLEKFTKALQIPGCRREEAEAEAKQLAVQSLVGEGQNIARQSVVTKDDQVQVNAAKLARAVDVFNKARDLNPAEQLDPEREAKRMAAGSLVARGQIIARQSVVTKDDQVEVNAAELARAVDVFKKARDLDPAQQLDPEREAKRLAAGTLVTRGQTITRQSVVSKDDHVDVNLAELNRSVGVFRKAHELDPSQQLDPEREARPLVAESLVRLANPLLLKGKIQQAVEAYKKAEEYDPKGISSFYWNGLCWWGSLWDQAERVRFAGDRAVEQDPNNAGYRDSRGLARALTGDPQGAIDDFKVFVKQSQRSKSQIEQRERWIQRLETGANPPIPPEDLLKLRQEASGIAGPQGR